MSMEERGEEKEGAAEEAAEEAESEAVEEAEDGEEQEEGREVAKEKEQEEVEEAEEAEEAEEEAQEGEEQEEAVYTVLLESLPGAALELLLVWCFSSLWFSLLLIINETLSLPPRKLSVCPLLSSPLLSSPLLSSPPLPPYLNARRMPRRQGGAQRSKSPPPRPLPRIGRRAHYWYQTTFLAPRWHAFPMRRRNDRAELRPAGRQAGSPSGRPPSKNDKK